MKPVVQAESGHVLLLLTLLLSTGAGVVSVFQANRVTSDWSIDRALAARNSLTDARTALLAYSAGYAKLYGAGGAGPGHLPCPDTDTGNDPGLAGPNPPCGRNQLAMGALPRHVTLRRHRHAFHVEPDQRIQYAVSTGYVNNPLNRIVNARGATDAFDSLHRRWIASLSMPVGQGSDNEVDDLMTMAVVTREQLMKVVRPAVLRWFIQHVSKRLMSDCLADAPCPRMTELISDDSEGVESTGEIQGDDLLEWLRDPDSGFIESVPTRRHWFVRNGWIRDVALRVDSECLFESPMQHMLSEQPVPRCQLVAVKSGSTLPMVIALKRFV